METMLFTNRSIWAMIHGVALGGLALMALFAGIYSLQAMRQPPGTGAAEPVARPVVWMLVTVAVALWLTVLVGTYINFPPYRATPPEGATDLGQYPRALLLSQTGTRWLHAFAMEIKEHMPWIAAMLATAVAFVAARYRGRLLSDAGIRNTASALLVIAFLLTSFVGVLGVFINKVAPLE